MGFRATLALAAAVLPRAATLRPNIRGGRILEAAAAPCPADDCCLPAGARHRAVRHAGPDQVLRGRRRVRHFEKTRQLRLRGLRQERRADHGRGHLPHRLSRCADAAPHQKTDKSQADDVARRLPHPRGAPEGLAGLSCGAGHHSVRRAGPCGRGLLRGRRRCGRGVFTFVGGSRWRRAPRNRSGRVRAECGTDKKLDNCACEACGKNGAPICEPHPPLSSL